MSAKFIFEIFYTRKNNNWEDMKQYKEQNFIIYLIEISICPHPTLILWFAVTIPIDRRIYFRRT